MNPRLRHWREAATLLLAAGTPGRPPRSPLGSFDYELLLLRRSSRSGFMPGAHVFPGGLAEPADFSAEWLGLLPASPHCGLGAVKPPPPGGSRAPLFATDRESLGSQLPGEVAFRICALRETFEEAGILLLVPGRGPAPPLPAERLPPAAELGEWRRRVREDASCFLRLCRHLGCAPNIWALHEWSNWLTPVGRAGRGGRRYDTAFFLCCLEERPPHVSQDDQEVTAVLWSSPTEAIERFKSQEIWFPPPQFYEFCRLCNFPSLGELQKFSSARALEGCERWMPVMLSAADGFIQLLPGDELYPEDPDYTGEKKMIMSTDKKVDDLMKESGIFHRMNKTQAVAGFADLAEVCKPVLNNDHVKQNTVYCAVEYFLNILAGCDIPVLQSLETLPACCDCNGECPRNHTFYFPPNPGMHLIKSKGLVYVQVSQMFSPAKERTLSSPGSSGTWEMWEA